MSTVVAYGSGQSFEALALANEQRLTAAAWRMEMKLVARRNGRVRAAEILLHEPETVGSLRVFEFLHSVPGVGEVGTERILMRRLDWRVWPLRRVRQLTDRQRRMLAEALVEGRA